MAMGSRRTTPTAPVVAAVVSEASVAPRKVPCCQLNAWTTSGISFCRRTPKRMALIGTPVGFSHWGEIDGHWLAGDVNRLFGWAAGSPLAGVHAPPPPARAGLGGG